jgi:Putative Ig domain
MAMSPRERVLAIGVGATIGLFGLQYGFSSINATLAAKRTQVELAEESVKKLNDQIQQGKRSQDVLRSLKAKSLPTSAELLNARYGELLTKIGQEVGLTDIKITPHDTNKQAKASKTPPAFTSYKFTMQGQCRIDQLVELLAKYYEQDVLHTITNLKVKQQGNFLTITLDSQAIALRGADPKQEFSKEPSGRLAKSAEEYEKTIIGRHPFAPPNQPPKLATSTRQEIKRGERWSLKLEGSDPDKDEVSFELVSKDLPEGLKFSNRSGELSGSVSENGSYEVLVRVTDNGLPAKSSEHKMALKVVDPPPPPVEVEKPKFDAAEQSRVTAMVGGAKGPQVWVRSLTDGKSFQLSEGDDFEVGTIKAKVLSINLKESFAEFETEGIRWIVGMDSMLKEAYEKSKVN